MAVVHYSGIPRTLTWGNPGGFEQQVGACDSLYFLARRSLAVILNMAAFSTHPYLVPRTIPQSLVCWHGGEFSSRYSSSYKIPVPNVHRRKKFSVSRMSTLARSSLVQETGSSGVITLPLSPGPKTRSRTNSRRDGRLSR